MFNATCCCFEGSHWSWCELVKTLRAFISELVIFKYLLYNHIFHSAALLDSKFKKLIYIPEMKCERNAKDRMLTRSC